MQSLRSDPLQSLKREALLSSEFSAETNLMSATAVPPAREGIKEAAGFQTRPIDTESLPEVCVSAAGIHRTEEVPSAQERGTTEGSVLGSNPRLFPLKPST